MKLTSSAFENRHDIPVRYTQEGEDVSPPISWSEAPEGTRSFALLCEDPDAPPKPGRDHPIVHWMIYNIPGTLSALPEGLPAQAEIELPVSANQGVNTMEKIGYRGPKPPPGPAHRYVFTLYALDKTLSLPEEAEKKDLLKAMSGSVIDQVVLVGKYASRSAESKPQKTA